MSVALTDQIVQNMQQKTTDELLAIWSTNDRAQWSEAAFDAISRTLSERGVDVPAQSVYVPPAPRKKKGKGWILLICIYLTVLRPLVNMATDWVLTAYRDGKPYTANEARLVANQVMAVGGAFYLVAILLYFSAAKLIRVMRERREERRVLVPR